MWGKRCTCGHRSFFWSNKHLVEVRIVASDLLSKKLFSKQYQCEEFTCKHSNNPFILTSRSLCWWWFPGQGIMDTMEGGFCRFPLVTGGCWCCLCCPHRKKLNASASFEASGIYNYFLNDKIYVAAVNTSFFASLLIVPAPQITCSCYHTSMSLCPASNSDHPTAATSANGNQNFKCSGGCLSYGWPNWDRSKCFTKNLQLRYSKGL